MQDSEKNSLNRAYAGAGEHEPAAPSVSAVAMIDEGNDLEEQGRISDAMTLYDAAARADPRCARAHLNRGNILLQDNRLDEARSAYQLAIECEPQYAAAHFNLGNLQYRLGDFELALRSYQIAVGVKPEFVDAHVALGNALDSLGRAAEAVESYERALNIHPDYAEVHFNLGMISMTQGRYDDAVRKLRRAVDIKPGFTQAHRTMGMVLSKLEKLDEAEVSHRRALAIEPESEEILYELTMILMARGKPSEALPLLLPALERTPTWAIKAAFVTCVARTGFLIADPRVGAALTTAITEPWGTPYQLCRPALSLLMLDRRIARCVSLANAAWPARLSKLALFGADGLAAVATDPLLRAMLEASPVSTIEFERFLTCARHVLLETASSTPGQDTDDIAVLSFYAALARQCFVNEYIFDCDDQDTLAAEACRANLLAILDAGRMVPPLLLLAVASHGPLYRLRSANRFLDFDYPALIDAVLQQQIRDPLREQWLRAGIKCLTPISSGVSEEVRSQYEQNPYPRWVKQPIPNRALPFNEQLRRALPFARFLPMPDDSAPEALIAGCGTGNHSIFTAQRFRGIRVLAIDLSLSSLSYAKRKTQELKITNIEYAQADILKFGGITRTFDVIESVGVLHHLADPFAGWRALLSRLRPGGFMRLGFYSEIARRHLTKARDAIRQGAYSSDPNGIRLFRRDVAARDLKLEQSLAQFPDYFSTSECRDLLFHVQEHRLKLDQIESFLAVLGVSFLGFELDRGVLHQYRVRFAEDPSATSLRNWAEFETEYPDTFVGMYQFWVQKTA